MLKRKSKPINLGDQLNRNFGHHRAGWNEAVRQLKKIHSPEGLYLDTFVEFTFLYSKNIKAYEHPWAGIVHVPPEVPEDVNFGNSGRDLLKVPEFMESLDNCRGLFALSEHHAKFLRNELDFPVETIKHPVDRPTRKWNRKHFEKNSPNQLIHIGWWLRDFSSFFRLDVEGFQKLMPRAKHHKFDDILQQYSEIVDTGELNSVKFLDFLPDRKYDKLLSESIVFIDLIDSSANNTVLECISRNSPILVNRHPAVEEYLGSGYPFYYSSLKEAEIMLKDEGLITKTHEYLKDHPFKDELSYSHFLDSIAQSPVVK